MNTTANHPPANPVPVRIEAIGMLCGLGLGQETFTAAVFEGEGDWSDIPSDDAGPALRVARIPDFDLAPYLNAPKTYLDPHSRAVLAALHMAQPPKTDATGIDPGLLLGTAWGNTETMARFFDDAIHKGPRLVKPFLFPHTYANTSAALGCMEWQLKGPHQVFTSGLTASGQAILEALDLLREGHAGRLFAGGAEIVSSTVAAMLRADTQTAPPEALSAPFDSRSSGYHPGEAVVILSLATETVPHPGTHLLDGALAGSGSGRHRAETVRRVVKDALRRANVDAATLAFACVSADGTPPLDADLASGLDAALSANRRSPLPLVTPAALCGRTGGVTDALLCATATILLREARLPATTPPPDRALPGCLHLPSDAVRLPTDAIGLTLSLDANGTACALVLSHRTNHATTDQCL